MNYLSLLALLVHHYIPIYVLLVIFEKIALLIAGIIMTPLENKMLNDTPYHILSIIINFIINLVTIEYINIMLFYGTSEGLEKIPLLIIGIWIIFVISSIESVPKSTLSIDEKIVMLLHEETIFDKYKKIIPYINILLLIVMNVFKITFLSDVVFWFVNKITFVYEIKIIGNVLNFTTNVITGIALIWAIIQTLLYIKSFFVRRR